MKNDCSLNNNDYISVCVKVGRSGSRSEVQSGGRRLGWAPLIQSPWRSLPASQLVAGDQRKRNQRKGLWDPHGTAGRGKEGVVTYFLVLHTHKALCNLKKSWRCNCPSLLNVVLTFSLSHSGTETKGQGVWASVAGQESAGAGAGGADCQSVRGNANRCSLLTALSFRLWWSGK